MATQRAADQDLVRRFLASVDAYTGTDVEHMVPGITQGDVSRWRRGDWEWISHRKRRALENWLGMRAHERTRRAHEVEPERPRPNYAGLGFDVRGADVLEPEAAHLFDEFILEAIRAGHDKATVELLAEMLLCPVAALERDPAHSRRSPGEIGVMQARLVGALLPVVARGLTGPIVPPGGRGDG